MNNNDNTGNTDAGSGGRRGQERELFHAILRDSRIGAARKATHRLFSACLTKAVHHPSSMTRAGCG